MDLELLNIVVDTGICALVWLVQLVIYPGFCYYSESDVKKWHRGYTHRISWIVFPLMLSQLLSYAYLSIMHPSFSSVAVLLFVISTWIVTFFMAVPLHQQIDTSVDSYPFRAQLVRVNWIRTIAWTCIWIISLLNYGE